jgi:hypothetical protein
MTSIKTRKTLKPALAALRPHPSIPVEGVKAPPWHLASGVMRSCWNCDKRVTGPWVSRLTGMCLCHACHEANFVQKPRGVRRARQGTRVWRK